MTFWVFYQQKNQSKMSVANRDALEIRPKASAASSSVHPFDSAIMFLNLALTSTATLPAPQK